MNTLYQGRELVLNAFKSGIFPLKSAQGMRMKMLTPKRMLWRLPITLAQVKAANGSWNLLSEIRQVIYFLHQAKEFNEKVYDNIVKNSIQIWYKNGCYIYESKK